MSEQQPVSNMSRRYPSTAPYARHKQGEYKRGPHLYGKAMRTVPIGEGYDELMEYVCDRMRTIRLEQQISVDELASAIGIHKGQIHRWESPNWRQVRCHRWPTMKRIVQVARALGVLPIDFMPSDEA